MSVTGKYAPLYRWLKNQPADKNTIDVTFQQIEKILGASLPPSAKNHEAWWYDSSANTSHVQAYSWLEAGWRVRNLSLDRQRVQFYRL